MCMLLSFQRPSRLAGGDSSVAALSGAVLPSGHKSLAHLPREAIPLAVRGGISLPRRGRVAGSRAFQGVRPRNLVREAENGALARDLRWARRARARASARRVLAL